MNNIYGIAPRYTYNAAGERIMKSYGTMEGVYINGAPQGITFHETDNFTLYPASILSVNKNRFTKHYFIGDKRVASRIGTGLFNNVYGRNGSYVTAGQQDYAERMNQIQKQKEAYYKQQGIAPGVPTEKGAYGDPENTGVGYNAVLSELGNHDVPQGWIQTPRPNTTPNTNPGPPVSWNDPTNPDDPRLVMVTLPTTLQKRKSSSIIVTTSAAPLILPTLRLTLRSSMPTCHTESCWWMNILHLRICHISSMVRN